MPKSFKFFAVILLFFSACLHPESKKGGQPGDTAFHKIEKAANDSVIVDSINHLIDITYDNPGKVVAQPDSFINRIGIMPSSILGKRSYTLLLLNIGYVLREHGLILPSTRFYERALDYYKKNKLKEPDFVLYIAKPLANLYTRIDDIQKSVSLQKEAIKIATRKGQLNYLPSLYNNLAIAYQTNGQFNHVIAVCQKGLSYIHSRSIYSALLNNSLANAYLETNKIDSAEYFNHEALRQFQTFQLKEDTLVWFTGALKLESDIAKYRNNISKAIYSLNEAIKLTNAHFPNSRQRVKAKYLIARGQLNIDKNPHASISDFQAAINLLDSDNKSKYLSDYTYTDALFGLAKTYSVINIDSALYYYAKTIENDYLTQELIVSKAGNYKNSAWNRNILCEYVNLLEKAYRNTSIENKKQSLAIRMFWAIEMSKGRQIQREISRSRQWSGEKTATKEDRLRNKLLTLHRELAVTKDTNLRTKIKTKISNVEFQFQLSEKYFEQTFHGVDFKKFQTFLLEKSKTQTLVSYLVQKNGLSYIVYLSNAKAIVYTLSENQYKNLNIGKFIADYFGADPYAYENDPDLYFEHAKKITQALLPFIESAKKELILSPDGALFKLPMDAMKYHGKFIVESKTISYTYSFILNFLHQSRQEYHSDVLFFGKSKYKGRFKNLNFVEDEKKMIANHFRGKTFEGKKATIQSFLTNLHTKDIIHLATHAVADPQPYIVFEKPLTLGSLSVVDMQSPLVVLSSCESADGKLIKAEGLESLNRAFISKGVRGVIAAQWPVDDKSIAQLMGLFYEKLYKLKNPVEALTNAKREFINGKNAVYKNPWYWASMNYMGIETEIQIKKKAPIWIFIGAVVLIGLSFLIFHKRKRRVR